MTVKTLKLTVLAKKYVSWNFKTAPGFFEVLSWTGDGTSSRTISHNLGSVPGMIAVKNTTDTGYSWAVWHRNLSSGKVLFLNSDNGEFTQSYFPSQPTASNFTVNNSGLVNINGDGYVAYVFAHDDQSFGTNSDEAIIKCGSYTGNGQVSGTAVNVGFEPQWVMIKAISSGGSSASGNWIMQNTMTGMAHDSSGNGVTVGNGISANTSSQESGFSPNVIATATGFEALNNSSYTNGNGVTYIYMAIRRPNKPPEAGTDVFDAQTSADDGGSGTLTSTSVTADLTITGVRSSGWDKWVVTRLIGNGGLLRTNQSSAETSYTQWSLDEQNGFRHTAFFASNSIVDYTFRRAAGFFDIVAYQANNNVAFNVNHNLGVAPELVIIKARDGANDWLVGADALTGWGNYGLQLNSAGQENTSSNYFNGAPTSTQIKLGTASDGNYGTRVYIAYLFSSLDNVSKIGSYTGTGNDIDIDCGFTNGARFVMVKRLDATGDWFVMDTARGIGNGDDPYILLNSSAAEVNNNSIIDPDSSGFQITGDAPAGMNASGGTYLYLAIA